MWFSAASQAEREKAERHALPAGGSVCGCQNSVCTCLWPRISYCNLQTRKEGATGILITREISSAGGRLRSPCALRREDGGGSGDSCPSAQGGTSCRGAGVSGDLHVGFGCGIDVEGYVSTWSCERQPAGMGLCGRGATPSPACLRRLDHVCGWLSLSRKSAINGMLLTLLKYSEAALGGLWCEHMVSWPSVSHPHPSSSPREPGTRWGHQAFPALFISEWLRITSGCTWPFFVILSDERFSWI